MVAGGGGRSSIGTSSLGGDGGDLSNSAIGASSGIGDTELLSIADNFIGDTLAAFTTTHNPPRFGGYTKSLKSFNDSKVKLLSKVPKESLHSFVRFAKIQLLLGKLGSKD